MRAMRVLGSILFQEHSLPIQNEGDILNASPGRLRRPAARLPGLLFLKEILPGVHPGRPVLPRPLLAYHRGYQS